MSLVVELEDEFAEDIVEGADERSQHHDCDENDDRVVDGLGLGRPRHLAQLGANLLKELARTRALGAGLRARRRLRPATFARRCAVLGHLTLALEHSLGFSVHRHGGWPCCRERWLIRTRRLRRAGGTRTPNRRFWRPVLFQLSYCPLGRFELVSRRLAPGFGDTASGCRPRRSRSTRSARGAPATSRQHL